MLPNPSSKSEPNYKLIDTKAKNSPDFHSADNSEMNPTNLDDFLSYSSISTHEFAQIKKIPSIGGIGNFKISQRKKSRLIEEKLSEKRDRVEEEGDCVRSTKRLKNGSFFTFDGFAEQDDDGDELFNIDPVLSQRAFNLSQKPQNRKKEDKIGLNGVKKSSKTNWLFQPQKQDLGPFREAQKVRKASKRNKPFDEKHQELHKTSDPNQPNDKLKSKEIGPRSSASNKPFNFETQDIPHFTQKSKVLGPRKTPTNPQVKYFFDREYKDIKNDQAGSMVLSNSFMVDQLNQHYLKKKKEKREKERLERKKERLRQEMTDYLYRIRNDDVRSRILSTWQ